MNGKRKAEDEDDPICPHGSSCYRKNPQHRKKYHSKKPILKDSNSTKEKQIPTKGQNSCVSSNASSETLDSNSTEEKQIATKGQDSCVSSDPSSKTLPLTDKRLKSVNSKGSETVEDVLNSMPPDFLDFWNFCSSVNKSKPAEAFTDIGLHLVGVYDLLSKKIPKDQTVVMHTHWRYYYDPPEFQTVIKSDDKDLYHIGYFRDDPAEFPTILAANSAKTGPKLTVKGDNIFAAVDAEITKRLKDLDAGLSKNVSKIQEKLKQYAKKKGYSLQINSAKVKARQKSVVTATFHGLGIVVPFKNDIGYRPLPDSDKKIKSILQSIVDAKSEDQRLSKEEFLDEIITNVHFGNDEGDFGMGLELGIDLFCFGNAQFHTQCLDLLTIAYRLLKRNKYIEVLTAHLANRRNDENLNAL